MMNIRNANPADKEQMVSLLIRYGAQHNTGLDFHPLQVNSLVADCIEYDHPCSVAEEDGEVVGFVVSVFAPSQFKDGSGIFICATPEGQRAVEPLYHAALLNLLSIPMPSVAVPQTETPAIH